MPNIDKLSEQNWPVWKLQVQTYLEARELWPLCTGEESRPVAPESGADATALSNFAQKLSKYQVRVARVKSILLQTVSTSQLHIIAKQQLCTPQDMWNELIGTFERPSLSNKLQLQTRLLDIAMKPGSSVDTYFKDLQDLVERLAALKAPVEPDFQVAIALQGLPAEYDALRVAFVAKGTVTINELHEALQTEERRLKPNVDSAGGASVLAAQGKGGKQRFYVRSPGPPGSCFGCGQMGHIHKNCPTNPYVPSKKQKSKGVGKHVVKKAEHLAEGECIDSNDCMLTALYNVSVNSLTSCSNWIIDSGATKHMSPNYALFSHYVPFRVPESVSLGNGSVCEAVGIGRVEISVLCDGVLKHYTMSDVLYVPHLMNNFFSVTAVTLKGHEVNFVLEKCTIRRNGEPIATGHQINHVWYVDCPSAAACEKLSAVNNTKDLTLWHQRLGHVNERRLKDAVRKHLIVGVESVDGDLPFCEACVQGKQTRKPFKGSADVHAKQLLQLIHSDVCGPTSVASMGGSRYFVTFTDDYSRWCKVYFLKNKSEVFEKFKEFEAEVTNQTGQKIKAFRSDNGGEYTSADFKMYLKGKGIRHELTTPYTPQQNGLAERLNRTLQEMALSQLVHAGLPKSFWADSVATPVMCVTDYLFLHWMSLPMKGGLAKSHL